MFIFVMVPVLSSQSNVILLPNSFGLGADSCQAHYLDTGFQDQGLLVSHSHIERAYPAATPHSATLS
ncbi:MAG: hypothetical protein LBU07_07660 [Coriobacteriales bacterium]|nr:hypothetical protein [Coriobacteriales bacterium]